MEAPEQIKKFKEFIEMNYYADLLEKTRKKENSLSIDFTKISMFSPDLANDLLETPEDTLKAFEISISEFDIPEMSDNFKIRIKNLTESRKLMIRNIRSEHLKKLYYFDGTVRQKSDVRPQVTSARFECPSCGNIINVLQTSSKFNEPTRCGCGRKGKFRMLSKELIDAQGMVLEEATKDLEGGEQPKRINVLLKSDLVSPISDRKTNPGANIRITGMIEEVPIILRSGGLSTKFDLMIDCLNVEPLEEDYSNIQITEKEEEEIKLLSQDKELYDKMATSLAPGIYGHDLIKEALLMQFVGGVRKMRSDGVSSRGDIHILLIGDPGAGKSQLLKRGAVVAPKARYVSGKGVSGAGLTAAVVKDEFLQGWSLEGGALVLANRGILMIDELDKMSTEDRSAMHEGLEQQTVSISKANIQATLRCETTVLAAANPKMGRFDPYETIAKQIDLPPALINRFDLIFTIKDMPDEDLDKKLSGFILRLHQAPKEKDVEIDTEQLRRYLVYARQKVFPKITEEAAKEIQNYYIKMRASGSSEEKGLRAIPISARQLEALVRLSEAAAKIRLSDKVTKKDAQRAIKIFHYCLEQVGMDPETGKIDIDRITTGIPTSERSKLIVIKNIIADLEEKVGKVIPVQDIIEAASEHNISEDMVEESIEKLKRSGDLFEPRRSFVSRLT